MSLKGGIVKQPFSTSCFASQQLHSVDIQILYELSSTQTLATEALWLDIVNSSDAVLANGVATVSFSNTNTELTVSFDVSGARLFLGECGEDFLFWKLGCEGDCSSASWTITPRVASCSPVMHMEQIYAYYGQEGSSGTFPVSDGVMSFALGVSDSFTCDAFSRMLL